MTSRRAAMTFVLTPGLGAVLLGCESETGPMPDPLILRALQCDDPVLEGRRARFTMEASGVVSYRVMRSDDSGFHYVQVGGGPGDLFFGGRTIEYFTEPVDYARDHAALWRIDLFNIDAAGDRLSGTAHDGPMHIPHIVRITGFDREPGDAATGAGGTVRVEAEAHGERLAWQWQRSDDHGASFADLPGQTTSTLQLDRMTLADDGALVRVQVSGWNGNATSRAARLTVSRQPPVVFEDSDFADADWSVEPITVGTGGTSSVLRHPGEGRPAPCRVTTVWVNTAHADSPSAVYMLNWRSGAVYMPAVHGALVAVDYSEDQRRFEPSTEQSSALIARQAGHLYFAAPSAVDSPDWSTQARPALGPSDFTLLRGADANRPIDFSATASAIEFGFLRANNVGAGGNELITTGGIDNWRVTCWR